MKIVILAMLLTTFTFANTYKYRLFENTINEYTPFTINIVTVGEFKKGAEVMRVYLDKEIPISYPIQMFNWEGASLHKNFKFKWSNDNTLTISSKRRSSFRASVKSIYMNPWGDTSINPEDEYALYFDNGIRLNSKETLNDTQFRIENITAEESTLWGILKQ